MILRIVRRTSCNCEECKRFADRFPNWLSSWNLRTQLIVIATILVAFAIYKNSLN